MSRRTRRLAKAQERDSIDTPGARGKDLTQQAQRIQQTTVQGSRGKVPMVQAGNGADTFGPGEPLPPT